MASLTVGELAQLLGVLLGEVLFITLIVVDIRKAVKKGNLWVPGHALVLSALTIQLMNFVEDRSALLNRALLDQNSNCTDVSKVQFMNLSKSRVLYSIRIPSHWWLLQAQRLMRLLTRPCLWYIAAE